MREELEEIRLEELEELEVHLVICGLAVQFEPRAVATNGQLLPGRQSWLMTGANKIIRNIEPANSRR